MGRIEREGPRTRVVGVRLLYLYLGKIDILKDRKTGALHRRALKASRNDGRTETSSLRAGIRERPTLGRVAYEAKIERFPAHSPLMRNGSQG